MGLSNFVGGLLSGYGNFLINLSGYLSDTSPAAPATTGYQAPFTPLYTGGQSVGVVYKISITTKRIVGGVNIWYRAGDVALSVPSSGSDQVRALADVASSGVGFNRIAGAVTSIYVGTDGKVYVKNSSSPSGFILFAFEATVASPHILQSVQLLRADNATDTGGNVPNPNPIVLNPDGGSVASDYPTSSPIELVPAALPVLAPATITALLAALANAANLAAIAANLAELIKLILDWMKEYEGKDPSKRSLVYRELGAIEKDGFIRFYPFVRGKSIAISLDVRFYSLPVWKKDTTLGSKSPNRYRDLGRILFVSETFGIIEEKELTYGVNSIPIPESAIGCYYHLGLDGVAKAYVNCFYLE
jgi:hypothetical protein